MRTRPTSQRDGSGRMQDVLFIAGTVAFFIVMAAFVVGCERIIGARDDECTPGGIDESAEAAE